MEHISDAAHICSDVQAQLVSAVRTAINTASDPLLLEAGLELATRVCIRTKMKFLFCYY